MKRVRFYSSPLFVQRKLTWRGFVDVPHPTLIQLSAGVYFGHPDTVQRYKAEMSREILEQSLHILGPVLNQDARKN